MLPELTVDTLALGAVWYVVFLFSLTLHEAGHAWSAYRLGDPTAYQGGQVSLNPWPHMRREPFGTVLVPILSFVLMGFTLGWASAPYDPLWAQRHPKRQAIMAAAGPAANLLLVLAAALGIRAGLALGVFFPPETLSFDHMTEAVAGGGAAAGAATFLSVLFSLNLLLLIFNLLPLPPLDGSSMLTLFMSAETAEKYRAFTRQPMMSLVGFLIAWRLFSAVFRPLQLLAVRVLYPEIPYG